MSAECPVSLITPESAAILDIANRNRHLKEISGTSVIGSDASKWPAKLVDAFEILAVERLRVENARAEADDEKMRRLRGKSDA